MGKEGTSGLSALKGMISFFTLWHMDITEREMDSMETRFHLVPVVGVLFGIPLMLAMTGCALLNHGMNMALISAAVCLLIVYIGSKFIHFDGLTDFGDGMIVSGSREDHIRALKDTLVGAGGIGVALAVTLTTFAVYSSWGPALLILLAPLNEVMVKNAMVFAASFGLPGKGMAGKQVELTTPGSAVKGILVTLLCGALLALLASFLHSWVTGFDVGSHLIPSVAMLATGIAVSAIVGCIMARNANRVFGMVNGDILGATNEVCRPISILAMGVALLLVV
ncbi:MAG: adenosylcobinamide-GDP ribazoletransferase [Candidatus Methanomethylophilaceae archaeon]|nr:adenosylcobinamide-GDP ribazoletransferase [Candidatus Methanomethylophilaceae archaeon]